MLHLFFLLKVKSKKVKMNITFGAAADRIRIEFDSAPRRSKTPEQDNDYQNMRKLVEKLEQQVTQKIDIINGRLDEVEKMKLTIDMLEQDMNRKFAAQTKIFSRDEPLKEKEPSRSSFFSFSSSDTAVATTAAAAATNPPPPSSLGFSFGASTKHV